jgi:hypothetical protein
MGNLKKKLEELPPVFGRKAVENLLPGIISSKTLANYLSLGKGPNYYKLGRNVFYQRDEFIEWLLTNIKSFD